MVYFYFIREMLYHAVFRDMELCRCLLTALCDILEDDQKDDTFLHLMGTSIVPKNSSGMPVVESSTFESS